MHNAELDSSRDTVRQTEVEGFSLICCGPLKNV